MEKCELRAEADRHRQSMMKCALRSLGEVGRMKHEVDGTHPGIPEQAHAGSYCPFRDHPTNSALESLVPPALVSATNLITVLRPESGEGRQA